MTERENRKRQRHRGVLRGKKKTVTEWRGAKEIFTEKRGAKEIFT